MAHYPKPFYRAARHQWYVQIDGKQYRLGGDEAEAHKLYHRLMEQRGTQVTPEGLDVAPVSVTEVFEHFLGWAEKNRSAGTYKFYRIKLQGFADWLKAKRLTHMAADKLKPHHLREYADSKPGWNSGSKRGAIGAVQRAFNHALEDQILDRNPVARIKKPAPGRRENVLTPELVKEMLGHLTTEGIRDFLTVAWEAGARPQEMRRVGKRNLDEQNSRWVFEVVNSKGKKKARVVHLTAVALAISKKWAERYPDGPMFRNEDGQPWTAYAVTCTFYVNAVREVQRPLFEVCSARR